MKGSGWTNGRLMNILRQAEAGTPVSEVCRGRGVSGAGFYEWRANVAAWMLR